MKMDGHYLGHRFRKTEIINFPKNWKSKKSDDAEYWRNLQFPISIQESGPVNKLDVALGSPHYLAITGASKVEVYDPETNDVYKTFTKFKDGSYGAKFRADAKLICAGSGSNSVKLFELESKTQLRQFCGHVLPACCVDFLADMKTVASFSDDQTIKLWDITNEDQILSLEEHCDYVRCGYSSKSSSDIFVSGGYDHTVKVWDRRKNKSVFTLDHGSPVEDVILLPNDAMLVSAGGHDVKVWDLLAGGSLLAKFSPHTKTITTLGFATNNTRVFTASLDCHVKFHDLTTFNQVHSVKFPSAILTASVAGDDSYIAAGMTDGLVQILHRKQTEESVEDSRLKEQKFRYLKYTKFESRKDDIVIKEEKKEKEAKHDSFLRKFEHAKALDVVLKPYVTSKRPDYTYAVLKELKRRNALRKALAGRNDTTLAQVMNYLIRYINDARYSELIIEVSNEILDLYGEMFGQQTNIDKLLLALRQRVEREERNLKEIMVLQGSLDLILSASKSHLKPDLRAEEKQLRESWKSGHLDFNLDSSNVMEKIIHV